MTLDDFRRSSVRVGRMREILNDPTFAEAIVALRDNFPKEDAGDSADSIVSARLLSRSFGYELAITQLLSLSEPMPAEESEPPETFGVNLSEFQPPQPQ